MLSDSLKKQRREKTGNDVCNFISAIHHFCPFFSYLFFFFPFHPHVTLHSHKEKRAGGNTEVC